MQASRASCSTLAFSQSVAKQSIAFLKFLLQSIVGIQHLFLGAEAPILSTGLFLISQLFSRLCESLASSGHHVCQTW